MILRFYTQKSGALLLRLRGTLLPLPSVAATQVLLCEMTACEYIFHISLCEFWEPDSGLVLRPLLVGLQNVFMADVLVAVTSCRHKEISHHFSYYLTLFKWNTSTVYFQHVNLLIMLLENVFQSALEMQILQQVAIVVNKCIVYSRRGQRVVNSVLSAIVWDITVCWCCLLVEILTTSATTNETHVRQINMGLIF